MNPKPGLLHKFYQRGRERLAGRNLRRGDLARLQGRPRSALRAYRHAVALDPLAFTAQFNLAETLAELEQWASAVDAYRQTLELDPDYPPALRGLAMALFHSGDYSSLLDANFDAEKTGPECFELYLQIGDERARQNLIEDAIAAWRRAEKIFPASWQLQQKLGGILLRAGEFDAAIHAFEQVIAANPDYGEAWAGLGDTRMRQRRWRQASEAFAEACARDPDYSWHHFKRAETLVQLGRWDEAAEAWAHCLRIDPALPGLAQRSQETAFGRRQWRELEAFCQRNMAPVNPPKSKSGPADSKSILLIAPQPPWPPTGGATRTGQLIRYLGARHRLVVVCFHYSEFEIEIRQLLDRHCDFAYLTRPGGSLDGLGADIPPSVANLTTHDCRNALLRLRELAFDLVLFDFIHVAEYLDLFADNFTVLQEHNIESEILRQLETLDRRADGLAPGLERISPLDDYRSLQAYEARQWPRFDLRTVTSAADRDRMLERCSGDALVVPNGVATGELLPVEYDAAGPLLFMGHLSYAPNVDGAVYFVSEILPALVEADPEIRLIIAGRKPTEAVSQLATHPQVEILADPPDMQAVADRCSMTIVPLRMGSGTRLKILESMSMALPVVSTATGCEGLQLTAGEQLLVGDTPGEFAEAVLRLRRDPELALWLRANGRRLVRQEYDWNAIFAAYEAELVNRQAAAAV